MPDRRRRCRDPHRAHRGRRVRLARLPAEHRPGPALRLPRARALTTRTTGTAATRRSSCSTRTPRPSTAGRLGRGAVLLPLQRPGRAQRDGQRAAHDDVGRHQPVLRLAERPATAYAVPRDRHLRSARQGADDPAPRHPRGDPRDVRRDRPPGDDRAPHKPRRHGGRADAGAPVRRRPPGGPGPARTTGATTRSASSRRTTPTRRTARAASRCRSSRRW